MKWLYRDADAPALDYGVEKALDRLCPDFAMSWSIWVIDHDTQRPMVVTNPRNKGKWVRRQKPRWVLYVWSRFDHRYHMVVESDRAPDARAVAGLRKDLYENINGSIDTKVSDAKAKEQAAIDAATRSFKDDQAHWIRENRKRIHDHVFEGKHSHRDAKASSYQGQGYRGTARQGSVMRDLREDGFTEKPTSH